MSKKRKKYWSQPLRLENGEYVELVTCRCARSALWFVNNEELEERILAFLAKYIEKHEVILHAHQLMGNHFHMIAQFPKNNKAAFFRDFNARIAESVRLLVKEFDSGQLFERRYTPQVLPENNSIEKYFFYCALQCVSHGLCSKISEYPGYSFFSDAVRGIEKTYKYFAHGDYNEARKRNPNVSKMNYWRKHTLKFTRLPGYEDLTQDEYQKLMHEKLELRRLEILEESEAKFRSKSELKRVRPGSIPLKSKKGTRRPLVLTDDPEVRESFLKMYFGIVEAFKEACAKYRAGDFLVNFPPGTFKPTAIKLRIKRQISFFFYAN